MVSVGKKGWGRMVFFPYQISRASLCLRTRAGEGSCADNGGRIFSPNPSSPKAGIKQPVSLKRTGLCQEDWSLADRTTFCSVLSPRSEMASAPLSLVQSLNDNCHYQFRILLLGDSMVGKTSLLRRYMERCFVPSPCPTVGVEFYSKVMELPPGIKVKLQLWDTAGQERFRCITRSFYRNAVGVLFVFDMTNRRSFENIFEWYNEVTNVMEKVVFLLVGHKCDLQSINRVTTEEAEGMATSLGTRFIEASAKNNINVDLAFETIASAIYESLKNKEIDLQEGWDGVKIIHRRTSSIKRKTKPPQEKCQC
uniref:Ras-related protein Rab-42 isoform X1 n=2 Tax=Pogona vitticeps TaxID=103695 RepID=A0A6J0SI41_9SAUR